MHHPAEDLNQLSLGPTPEAITQLRTSTIKEDDIYGLDSKPT